MLVSVITINYNNCRGLHQTILSVVHQEYQNFEFIVIDGGSTDGSLDIIKNYSESIAFWISEKDRGIYHAMNKGVEHAHGDYCIFINSGDRFFANNVLEQVAINTTNEDIIVGKVTLDDKNTIMSPPPISGELTLYHLYSGAIPHQGTFIRTELLRKYPYDENLKISSDWKFFVQTLILDNSSIRYMDIYVARYNMDGVSSSNPELMRKEKDEVLASFFPPRVLADYKQMKLEECLTKTLTSQLKKNYGIDRLLYSIGRFLLKIRR